MGHFRLTKIPSRVVDRRKTLNCPSMKL